MFIDHLVGVRVEGGPYPLNIYNLLLFAMKVIELYFLFKASFSFIKVTSRELKSLALFSLFFSVSQFGNHTLKIKAFKSHNMWEKLESHHLCQGKELTQKRAKKTQCIPQTDLHHRKFLQNTSI
jgi:hypothetical protein